MHFKRSLIHMEENKICRSTELAADTTLEPVWDPTVPFPSHEDMKEPKVFTTVKVTEAKEGGYYYLHEATIAFHKGKFFAGWANHKTRETGDWNELVRGAVSDDGLHWSEPKTWAAAPSAGSESHNHPLIYDHNGTLYGFFVCWDKDHHPVTEIYIYNDETEEWEHKPGHAIQDFVPFSAPQKNEDGDYVIGGENHWDDAAVIISHGEDFLNWDKVVVPRPKELILLFPESATVYYGHNHFRVICRTYNGWHPMRKLENYKMETAPTAESFDGGRTWTTLKLSNLPLCESQPVGGRLSDGRSFVVFNSLEEGRRLLEIALTKPGETLFTSVYKIRHASFPRIRLFENDKGHETQLAYPKTLELNGNLYIIYSQGKEDCAMTIIPLDALCD